MSFDSYLSSEAISEDALDAYDVPRGFSTRLPMLRTY
jgi:hypothetical protein